MRYVSPSPVLFPSTPPPGFEVIPVSAVFAFDDDDPNHVGAESTMPGGGGESLTLNAYHVAEDFGPKLAAGALSLVMVKNVDAPGTIAVLLVEGARVVAHLSSGGAVWSPAWSASAVHVAGGAQ